MGVPIPRISYFPWFRENICGAKFCAADLRKWRQQLSASPLFFFEEHPSAGAWFVLPFTHARSRRCHRLTHFVAELFDHGTTPGACVWRQRQT